MNIKRQSWKILGENIHRPSYQRSGVENILFLRLTLVIALGFLCSRAFFLQMVLGGNNKILAQGNSAQVKLVSAERGIVVDRTGEIVARNTVDQDQNIVREYPFGKAMSGVLGYVGKITAEDLEMCGESCVGDYSRLIGKAGIEKVYESVLSGTNGSRLVEVEASGKEVREIANKTSTPGQTVKLTIDAKLSSKIIDILDSRDSEKKTVGAVVVGRVGSGEILSMVSYPTYDNNIFSGLSSNDKYKNAFEVVADSENKPMFNRVIAGMYPPGSVYKLVSAMAGLESDAVNATTIVDDTGELKVGVYRYGNWYFDQYGKTDGGVDLVKALKRSNDIYFYKLGEWTGVEKLRDWSLAFGLGKATGIDLPGEKDGRVPDPLWKERVKGERWFLGNTYHMSIGQGDMLVTPLQVAEMTGSVVSGKRCIPRLLFDKADNCQEIKTQVKNRELVVKGMREACSDSGTAFTFFDMELPVICKTGTAQHLVDHISHAWITVVLPKDKNKKEVELSDYEGGITITVLLEEAGEGSKEAGPVARLVADYILSRQDL